MMLDENKKLIITVWISLFLFVAIIAGVLVPTVWHIRKTAAESYALRVALEQRYEQSLRSRVTRQKLQEIKETISDFGRFLFKPGEELQLITFLENLATTHTLTQTINNSNLDKIKTSPTAEISFNVSGDYQNLLEYIAELERSDYFITIEHLELKPIFNKTGEASSLATLDINAKLYVNK